MKNFERFFVIVGFFKKFVQGDDELNVRHSLFSEYWLRAVSIKVDLVT